LGPTRKPSPRAVAQRWMPLKIPICIATRSLTPRLQGRRLHRRRRS
jgi:hypothetical protein